jgi:hypothetical protein
MTEYIGLWRVALHDAMIGMLTPAETTKPSFVQQLQQRELRKEKAVRHLNKVFASWVVSGFRIARSCFFFIGDLQHVSLQEFTAIEYRSVTRSLSMRCHLTNSAWFRRKHKQTKSKLEDMYKRIDQRGFIEVHEEWEKLYANKGMTFASRDIFQHFTGNTVASQKDNKPIYTFIKEGNQIFVTTWLYEDEEEQEVQSWLSQLIKDEVTQEPSNTEDLDYNFEPEANVEQVPHFHHHHPLCPVLQSGAECICKDPLLQVTAENLVTGKLVRGSFPYVQWLNGMEMLTKNDPRGHRHHAEVLVYAADLLYLVGHIKYESIIRGATGTIKKDSSQMNSFLPSSSDIDYQFSRPSVVNWEGDAQYFKEFKKVVSPQENRVALKIDATDILVQLSLNKSDGLIYGLVNGPHSIDKIDEIIQNNVEWKEYAKKVLQSMITGISNHYHWASYHEFIDSETMSNLNNITQNVLSFFKNEIDIRLLVTDSLETNHSFMNSHLPAIEKINQQTHGHQHKTKPFYCYDHGLKIGRNQAFHELMIPISSESYDSPIDISSGRRLTIEFQMRNMIRFFFRRDKTRFEGKNDSIFSQIYDTITISNGEDSSVRLFWYAKSKKKSFVELEETDEPCLLGRRSATVSEFSVTILKRNESLSKIELTTTAQMSFSFKLYTVQDASLSTLRKLWKGNSNFYGRYARRNALWLIPKQNTEYAEDLLVMKEHIPPTHEGCKIYWQWLDDLYTPLKHNLNIQTVYDRYKSSVTQINDWLRNFSDIRECNESMLISRNMANMINENLKTLEYIKDNFLSLNFHTHTLCTNDLEGYFGRMKSGRTNALFYRQRFLSARDNQLIDLAQQDNGIQCQTPDQFISMIRRRRRERENQQQNSFKRLSPEERRKMEEKMDLIASKYHQVKAASIREQFHRPRHTSQYHHFKIEETVLEEQEVLIQPPPNGTISVYSTCSSQ